MWAEVATSMEAQLTLIIALCAGLLSANLFSVLSRRMSYGFLGNSLLGILGAFFEYQQGLLTRWPPYVNLEAQYLTGIRPSGALWESLWPGFFAGLVLFLIFGLLKAIVYRPAPSNQD